MFEQILLSSNGASCGAARVLTAQAPPELAIPLVRSQLPPDLVPSALVLLWQQAVVWAYHLAAAV